MEHEQLFLTYLMEDKIYNKVDIVRNGWTVVLWKKIYVCELKWNVYLLEPYHLEPYYSIAEFKCVETIISKHQKDLTHKI